MTKEEHITYWVNTARHDWRTVQNMFKARDFVPALFFAHLVIEKLLKAHWVKDNDGNHPPRIHNLISLADKIHHSFTDAELVFMGQMNDFQLEGRYPTIVEIFINYTSAKKQKPF